jgi:hypothetical protein
MPRITALNASDMIVLPAICAEKAAFFSLIRFPAAIAKNAKTQVASFHRLGSLARCRWPHARLSALVRVS